MTGQLTPSKRRALGKGRQQVEHKQARSIPMFLLSKKYITETDMYDTLRHSEDYSISETIFMRQTKHVHGTTAI